MVQCYDEVPLPDFAGGSATDNCGMPVVTHVGDVAQTNNCAITIKRTYRATYACGNTNDCAQTITVQDTIAPAIACPGDFTVQCSSPDGATVSYPAAANDNCGSATLTCAPASGSVFLVGTTTVMCEATDACGNSSRCTFSVTVQEVPDYQVELSIRRESPTNDVVIMTWPITCDYVLEETLSLNEPIEWGLSSVVVQIVDGQYEARFPATGSTRYFRLRRL
jgi:hypothetical protein